MNIMLLVKTLSHLRDLRDRRNRIIKLIVAKSVYSLLVVEELLFVLNLYPLKNFLTFSTSEGCIGRMQSRRDDSVTSTLIAVRSDIYI